MLADSAHIQESDAAIFDQALAQAPGHWCAPTTACLLSPYIRLKMRRTPVAALRPLSFMQTTRLNEHLEFTFSNAGHILGSAFVLLKSQQNGRETKLLFSGDLRSSAVCRF